MLKQAAADFYKREYGVDLDPEKEVAILGGSKIGLVELPFALLNPGDTMLLLIQVILTIFRGGFSTG